MSIAYERKYRDFSVIVKPYGITSYVKRGGACFRKVKRGNELRRPVKGLDIPATLDLVGTAVTVRIVRSDPNRPAASLALLLYVLPLALPVEVNHIGIIHIIPIAKVIVIVAGHRTPPKGRKQTTRTLSA
jgi:hypothetical protein